MNYYIEVFKKYANFSDRATRSEYWYFQLFNSIISIFILVLSVVGGKLLILLAFLYGLVVLIPGLSVTIRRLHDINKSGWWFLVNFIPFVGGIILLVFMVMDTFPQDNSYGTNPKKIIEPTHNDPS